jgi:hypothetical protein
MFVGHWGPAFALKRWAPETPLWSLVLGVQLVDVGWSLFIATGVERVRIVPGFTESNALDLYYMPFTHSLVATFVWSAIAGVLIGVLAKQRRAGIAVALAVASHWLLDLLVHRPDLPIAGDNTTKLGLALWDYRWPAFSLEMASFFLGLALYAGGTVARDRIGRFGLIAFAVALVGIQLFNILGPPPPTPNQMAGAAFASYAGVTLVAWWIDRHRGVRTAA